MMGILVFIFLLLPNDIGLVFLHRQYRVTYGAFSPNSLIRRVRPQAKRGADTASMPERQALHGRQREHDNERPSRLRSHLTSFLHKLYSVRAADILSGSGSGAGRTPVIAARIPVTCQVTVSGSTVALSVPSIGQLHCPPVIGTDIRSRVQYNSTDGRWGSATAPPEKAITPEASFGRPLRTVGVGVTPGDMRITK